MLTQHCFQKNKKICLSLQISLGIHFTCICTKAIILIINLKYITNSHKKTTIYMILILKSSSQCHYCPRCLSSGMTKTQSNEHLHSTKKLINMCRVGLPLPFYEIKSRGHHAFLKDITVLFKILYGITWRFVTCPLPHE